MVLGRVEIENSIWPEEIGLVGWMVLGRVEIENSIWPEEIGLVGWMVLGRVEIENSIWPEEIGLVGWMVLGRVEIENSIWPEEIGLVGWMVLGRVEIENSIWPEEIGLVGWMVRFGGVDGAREGVDGKSNMPGGVERGLGDCEFGGDEGLIELGRVGPTVMELVQIGVGFCDVDDMACVEVEGMLSGDRFSGIDVSGN